MADEPENKKTEQEEETSEAVSEEKESNTAGDDAAENPEASESDLDPATELLIQEAVEDALARQKDTVMRAQAEVQNMRRRCEQDVERAHKYALEKFSAELLPVVDNLERALQSVPEEAGDVVKSLVEGVELTLKGFCETLVKFSIQQLEPVGEPFDPQLHEAMAMVPNPEVEPNTVIEVFQKGYTLNGRVLRPARVVVSKAE